MYSHINLTLHVPAECEVLEFSEAILSTLADDITSGRKDRFSAIATYTEFIGQTRVDPEVALSRFITEAYNPNK
jgi:hypothetical protein